MMAFAFADRSPAMEAVDVAGVSRLPCERFPTVRVVYDSVGATSNSPLTFDTAVAFPLSGQGRPPQKDVFGVQTTARLCLCERFATAITRAPRITRGRSGWLSLTPCGSFIRYPPPAYADAPCLLCFPNAIYEGFPLSLRLLSLDPEYKCPSFGGRPCLGEITTVPLKVE